jgi:hypothetical protein
MYRYTTHHIPQEYKENFVITIDEDDTKEAYDIKKETYDNSIDLSDPDNLSLAKAVANIMDMENFKFYIDWYVDIYQGTLEQPYKALDEDGYYLTAYSYYNYKNNNMMQLKLIFDEGSLDNVKEMLINYGFVFDKLAYKKSIDASQTSAHQILNKLGSIEMPHIFTIEDEEYCAFNTYNIDKDNMVEMYIVFDMEQLENIKTMLRKFNFIVL